MMTTTAERTAVARGAAVLDRKRPSWYSEIDVRTLNMGDSCRCVLGQIGENVLNLDTGEVNRRRRVSLYSRACSFLSSGAPTSLWSRRHGFDADYTHYTTYDGLKVAWLDEIQLRLDDEANA